MSIPPIAYNCGKRASQPIAAERVCRRPRVLKNSWNGPNSRFRCKSLKIGHSKINHLETSDPRQTGV